MEPTEYPIKTFDHLNRLIYIAKNDVERVVNIYWADTNQIKIKYRLWKDESETEIEAYNPNGEVIVRISLGKNEITLSRLKIINGSIKKWIISSEKINEWKNLFSK
jgi:hypothetical protein